MLRVRWLFSGKLAFDERHPARTELEEWFEALGRKSVPQLNSRRRNSDVRGRIQEFKKPRIQEAGDRLAPVRLTRLFPRRCRFREGESQAAESLEAAGRKASS